MGFSTKGKGRLMGCSSTLDSVICSLAIVKSKNAFRTSSRRGIAYIPEPWDVARGMRYLQDHKNNVDVPLSKDFVLYRKKGRLNKSNHHCLELNPRAARGNLRAYGYIAHVRLSKFLRILRGRNLLNQAGEE